MLRPGEGFTTLFPFLVGRLKTSLLDSLLLLASRFPFLVGRLKTVAFSPEEIYRMDVSIPCR